MSTTDPGPIRTGDPLSVSCTYVMCGQPAGQECTKEVSWSPLPALPAPAASRPHAARIRLAAQQQLDSDPAAARAGHDDAARTVAAHYAAGVDLDQLAAHHDDVSASLLSDAQTAAGRSYAQSYADVSASLIAELREDQAVARGRSEAACTKPEGTPHPDPVLAARGWQVDHGIYQRTGKAKAARLADREAG
jgi:hypothetical protein